jgi:hypothetical protein
MSATSLMQGLRLAPEEASAVATDYERFAERGLPAAPEEYVRGRYGLDLSSEYGGLPVKNPFGKGSGQLSLNAAQVRRDARAGLGFVVLKTFIAEDAAGAQSMSDWAIHETRMVVEPITGADGRRGWTVTWKGRGWYETFDAYLKFFADALRAGRECGMIVAPSCKYHLPAPGEREWKTGEYGYTTARLLDVWQAQGPPGPMPIEKDFSPTLAGSDRAAQVETVLRWLRAVSGLVRRGGAPRRVSVGLKLFNAVFEDSFQLEMLRAVNERCAGDERPDFLVYANRLFDPHREFDGVRGVAYGGPDLSARNLRVLARLRRLERAGQIEPCRLPLSATGNIESGRTACEYLLRGASSFQLHTYFQLPGSEFRMRRSGKIARALHELYFNPERGLIAWLLHLRRALDWPEGWNVKRMADFCADPANRLWEDHEPALR